MKTTICLFSVLMLSVSIPSFSDSFIYPIAQFNDNKVFVIYQKSTMQLELWIWDLQKAYAFKGLSSHIIPAGFKLLPSGNGFSFIDQGRMRIKQFGRRAPRSIEVSEPIYDITLIEWISDNACYLSAREHNYYGIYHMYSSGTVIPIIRDTNVDSMYPQKQNNLLFYIQRTRSSDIIQRSDVYHYFIMQTTYPPLPEQEDIDAFQLFGTSEQSHITRGAKSILIDNHKNPLIFLRMVSEHEGYVIEHQAALNEHDECVECVYHHLYYKDSKWHMVPLFCFSLPVNLLFNTQTRLYESILPLLPYHVDSTIYYVDCSHATHFSNLSIFAYNLTTKKINQLTCPSGENIHHFGLCMLNNSIYYGGSLAGCLCDPPDCTPSSEGFINFNLGTLKHIRT